MIEIRTHASIRDIPETSWDELAGPDAPPFVRHRFLRALEDTGCVGEESGWIPSHLTLNEDGELIAAAPAYVKTNSEGEFVFDHAWANLAHRLGLAYYPKLVCAVPFTPATGPRLLVRTGVERKRAFAVFAAGIAEIVQQAELSSAHVLFPHDADTGLLEDAGLMRRSGIQFQFHNEGYASFDDYLARFSSKRRHQIRRERRVLAESGVRVETLRDEALTPEIVDAIYAFYLATVDKFAWGRRYLNREFFEEVCANMRGSIEVVVAREGARIIAGAFNLASATTLFGRYWGASEERPFLHFEVCFYHSIDDAIRRKLLRFEPGAGGEHKLARGFLPTETHSAHLIADPGMRGVLATHLARERQAVQRSIEEHLTTAWGK